MTVGPAVSVVIASSAAGTNVPKCLERVCGAGRPDDVEIILCLPERLLTAELSQSVALAHARVVAVADPATIPQLYASGLRAARGACIAMTNGRCVPAEDWLQAIRRVCARTRGAAVVAGAVALSADASVVDRGVYFCEYGDFRPDTHTATVSGAAGANVIYSRDALIAMEPLLDTQVWEYFWHRALLARGVRMRREPGAVVTLVYHWTLTEALRERFHYSRVFAAERARSWPPWRRKATILATAALPILVLTRLIRRHVHAGWPFLSALPVIAVLTLAWAYGEALGSWQGPGDSLAKIEVG